MAARYHLPSGIRIFRDETTAKLYFAAAKNANSAIKIPTEVFPAEHQLYTKLKETPELSETTSITPQTTSYISMEKPPGSSSLQTDNRAVQRKRRPQYHRPNTASCPNIPLPPHPHQPEAPEASPGEFKVPKWPAEQIARLSIGTGSGAGGSLLWAYSSSRKHEKLYTSILETTQTDMLNKQISRAILFTQNRIVLFGVGLCGAHRSLWELLCMLKRENSRTRIHRSRFLLTIKDRFHGGKPSDPRDLALLKTVQA